MSPKLPVITPKKLIRTLLRSGFIFQHQSGSHRFYIHPNRPTKVVTVPYHNKDLKKGTLKSVLRQADLTVEELTELL